MLAGTYGESAQWVGEWVGSIKDLSSRYAFIHNLQTGVANLQTQLLQGAGGVFTTIGSVFNGLVGVIVVLVLSFYIIVEESAVKTLFQNIIPNDIRVRSSVWSDEPFRRLAAWTVDSGRRHWPPLFYYL
jgi:predicted PurR-regulated permease PerM